MLLQEICEQAEKKANKNIFDFLAYVYNSLKEENENGSIFLREFIEQYVHEFNVDKETEPTAISKAELSKQFGKYKALTDGFIDYLVSEHFSEEEFYQRLWNMIHDRTYYHDELASAAAFMLVCQNSLLPYFDLPAGIQMTNDEFRECLTRLKRQQKKVHFVLSNKYSQKTERASLLLSVLEETTDKKEQAVLLARLLDWIMQKKLGEE